SSDLLEFRAIMTRAFATSGGATAPVEEKPSKSSQLSMFGGSSAAVEKGSVPARTRKYHTATTQEERVTLVSKLVEQSEIAFEVVTSNELHYDFELKGLAFSFPGETHFVEVAKDKDATSILKEFNLVFSEERISKSGHNIKLALLVLKKYGVEIQGTLFDTMLAHYLIEAESSHELDILANQFLDYQMISSENESDNACERVELVLPLKEKLKKELETRGHPKLMSDIEMPLVEVLATMEAEGVKVDVETLSWMSEALKKDSEKVQKDIFKLAGTEFNIASPKQVGEVLFDQLKLIDKPKKTRTGQYATGEDVLLKLADEHEIVRKMLEFREYEKLRSTYVDALPRMISKTDGRIHTDYRQAVAATGRLSSM
ncbi:MAG: DNA polymerase, partial [Cyclobacteriaceae bacterium]